MRKPYLPLRCPMKREMPKGMSCLLSSAIKKQNLYSDSGRPQDTLYFGLGSCLGANPGSDSTDDAPKAKWYYSDGFDAYKWLWCHFGRYEVSQGKSETYSVEADNAEQRHYLARLAHKSRCFSRCPYALQCALRLLVYCFNSRQLYKQRFPTFQAHVMDFVNPLLLPLSKSAAEV